MQQNAADGLRYSASRGYLHDLDVPTLELQTEVLVTKVVIENGRAVGVEVTDIARRTASHPDRPRGQGGHPLGRLRRLRRSC